SERLVDLGESRYSRRSDDEPRTLWRPPQTPALLIPDDRNRLQPDVPLAMIVDGDARFASRVLQMVRDRGMHGVIVTRGQEAIQIAERLMPTAITLDPQLPDI